MQTKISKFTLQIYRFGYSKIMDFQQSDFEFDVLTTHNFFKKNYRLLKVKTHLDHSPITAKIRGYVHELYNRKLRED